MNLEAYLVGNQFGNIASELCRTRRVFRELVEGRARLSARRIDHTEEDLANVLLVARTVGTILKRHRRRQRLHVRDERKADVDDLCRIGKRDLPVLDDLLRLDCTIGKDADGLTLKPREPRDLLLSLATVCAGTVNVDAFLEIRVLTFVHAFDKTNSLPIDSSHDFHVDDVLVSLGHDAS